MRSGPREILPNCRINLSRQTISVGETHLVGESGQVSRSGFRGLFFPAFGRGAGLKRMHQPRRGGRNFIDGRLERRFIRFRWFVEAADFSYELQRSRANFFRCNRRIKIEERSDISAHFSMTSKPPSQSVRMPKIRVFAATVEMLKHEQLQDQHYFHCRRAKPPEGAPPPVPSSLLAASQTARVTG